MILNLFERLKLHNFIQSILLLTGMMLLVTVVGFLFAGTEGIFVAIFIGIAAFVLTPRLSSSVILSMYQAQKLDYVLAPELYEMLFHLSRKANLSDPPTLYYLPSQVLNSFTVGHNESASIVLSDGLLRDLNSRELFGVLAHEVSHLENNDLWVMNIADIISRVTALLSMFGFLLLILYMPIFLFASINFPWLLILILMIAPNISALMQLALSRSREFEADQNAVKLTKDPLGLASALSKIEILQKSLLRQVLLPSYRISEPSLLRTHPSSEERIRRLKAIADQDSNFENLFENHMPKHIYNIELRKPKRRFHGLWY